MLERFLSVRTHTEQICKSLLAEDSVSQPIVDVSPPKWHLAHTTWFFETFILKKLISDYKEFNPLFNFLFNSYYENIGDRVPRDKRGTITRPGLSEVLEYRKYVNGSMKQFLSSERVSEEVSSIVELGLQHEQQHQELLISDIKFILGQNPVFPAYQKNFFSIDDSSANRNIKHDDYLTIPEGFYDIGHSNKSFCFDNELGRHKVFLHAFKVRKGLVSNEEFMEFMEDGGYTNFNLWLADGWDWVKQNQITCPMYWHVKNDEWKIYNFHGLEDLPLKASVAHINYYEAEAFARWKGQRLLSEFEWEVASGLLSYGKRWEWTNSAYLPYPYFSKAEGAIGEYNGKFMINQMVLRGGSIASPYGHVRHTYRNFFPPDKQWQFTGIRLGYHI